MDVVVWLRSLGLGKYEAIFRENDIDETVLPSLTHENLKELGVASFGHRVKLLDAVAALHSDASGKTPSVDATTTSSAPSAHPEDRAERRQVTVMFSDLVGSTALSARMDPEDLREVISAYQKCVAETVQRFGGFVAKYMGDGVLVYFGYPQAHEDDAERAVRAGLELVAAVSSHKTQTALQTRVGIATGLVVVGDLIGSGEAQERGIVGETPNLAARLQGVAEPNCVVIAESTRKLLDNLFELEDLGAQDLKGMSGPLRAWVALRPASVESRFEAMHASALTELVGREEELELLLRRWSRAKTGEGQVVLLSGEPGIGKSRLTAALMDRLAGEPHTRLRYFCSPQHTDSALYPIISQMERAALIASWPEYMRECRSTGYPMIGEGRVFTTPEADIIEPRLRDRDIPPWWRKIWGIDIGNRHPFAAALLLWDREADTIHVHRTIRMSDATPIAHAAAMKQIGIQVPVAWPKDAGDRDRGSGLPIRRLYSDAGLIMLGEPATHPDGSMSTEAGIMEWDQREQLGTLKVASDLSDWLEERRNYHAKDGQIVKIRDDLMSATRIALMMQRFAKAVQLGSAPDAQATDPSSRFARGTPLNKPFDLFTGKPFGQ